VAQSVTYKKGHDPIGDGRPHTVTIDVMGADNGVAEIINGAISAAQQLTDVLHVILVGKEAEIKTALAHHSHVPPNISVQHAESVVSMDVSATDGARMRDSSISVGIRLVKDGKADAFVSPGNTGAVMATSLLNLGRIEGVSRPAITTPFPNVHGTKTIVLDAGANADCKPHHLAQFAVMGSVYTSVMFDRKTPKVGLLSIGEERSKGNDLILNAQELLKHAKINYVGNVEGRDILLGTVDVVVTDGFTGNILLKFAESIKPYLFQSIQRQVQSNLFSRMGVALLAPFLTRMKKRFDYAEAGGAPLLGVNGIVIICHGSSGAKAICNALLVAHELASKGLIERIHDELVTNHFGQSNSNGNKATGQDNRDRVIHATSAND
jgi:phosphate acyltransferase